MSKNLTNDERIRRLSQGDRTKLESLTAELYKSFHDSWLTDSDKRTIRVRTVVECLKVYPEATANFLIALMPWPTSDNAPENGEFRSATTGAIGRYIQMGRAHLVGHKGRKVSEKDLLQAVRSQGEQAAVKALRDAKVIPPKVGRKSAPKGAPKTGVKGEQTGLGVLQGVRNTLTNFKAKYGLVPAFAPEIENVFRIADTLNREMQANMARRAATQVPAGAKATVAAPATK